MKGMNWAPAVLATLALAACDNGSSAVETRDRSAEAAAPAAGDAGVDAAAEAPAAEKAVWSSNRRNSAEENLDRIYKRNGEAFDASSADDFAAKTRAFVDSPPRGTETITRANGDTLYYHAASNTFAVARRDGVPRTMFKPDDGAAYWAEQKTREAARSARASANNPDGGSGEG